MDTPGCILDRGAACLFAGVFGVIHDQITYTQRIPAEAHLMQLPFWI